MEASAESLCTVRAADCGLLIINRHGDIMLAELSIQNVVIIDRLRLSFTPGLNVLTGETGAGKSIIIDSLGAVLGARMPAEMLRDGADRARIEAVFDLTEHPDTALDVLLAEAGIESEDGTLILARELNRAGRSSARVNGQTVTSGTLTRIGERLVDIHGQSAHLSLLRAATHIDFLDAYAGILSRRAECAALVAKVRDVRAQLGAIERDDRELARRVDLLRFQVEEITNANLREGEDEQLRVERDRLANATSLQAVADNAYRLLREGTPPRGAALLDGLRDLTKHLSELARLDPALREAESQVDEIVYLLDDVASTVRDYRDGIEDDPDRLAQVEERLVLIRDLERKYGRSIDDVIAFGEEATTELSRIEGGEERAERLRAEEQDLLARIGKVAGTLSKARAEASRRLSKEIEARIAHLAMGRTRFTVYLAQEEDPEGVPTSGSDTASRRLAFDAKGIDRVEFLIAPNSGESPKPLAKVASGGETARLMLALKSVLAAADTTPTLVFDEVDVGIGGRSGQVVGETLWGLTGAHQVLCITHLAQVAAFAEGHFRITKREVGGRTLSGVDPVTGDERIEELAAMLDTAHGEPTAAARVSARDLADRAAAWKAKSESTAAD